MAGAERWLASQNLTGGRALRASDSVLGADENRSPMVAAKPQSAARQPAQPRRAPPGAILTDTQVHMAVAGLHAVLQIAKRMRLLRKTNGVANLICHPGCLVNRAPARSMERTDAFHPPEAASGLAAALVPEASPERASTVFRSGNERLYEAYNDLHVLAQDFEKPFDAPAILVVGHQTDGKSGE